MDVKRILEAWRTISRGPGYVMQKDDETGARRRKAVEEMDRNEAMTPAQKAALDKAKADYFKKGNIIKTAKTNPELEPRKAQGYHGKEDPGADMHGMMDRGDTKGLPRKKVKSMEATQMKELSPATKKSYINKAAADIDNRSYAQGTVDATNNNYDGKNNRKIANRLKGIQRATKDEAVEKPPFDNAKPINRDPKDQHGNRIKPKNRAKSLARAAARKAVGLKVK